MNGEIGELCFKQYPKQTLAAVDSKASDTL